MPQSPLFEPSENRPEHFLGKLKLYIKQFRITLLKHQKSIEFMKENQLWKGIWNYGWFAKFLTVIAIIAGFKFMTIFFKWLRSNDVDSPIAAASSLGSLFQDVAAEGYGFLFMGSMKYVMLIMLEVIVFHFCRKTLEVLTGEKGDASFKEFIKAQKRMIKVAVRCWVMESIMIAIAKVFIFGSITFIEPGVIFLIQSYYLGFAIVDNYNEQFELTIKESAEYTRGYIGVALAVGMILYLLLLVPGIGPILAPFVAAVTVTLAMYELSDLHKQNRNEGLVPVPLPEDDDIV